MTIEADAKDWTWVLERPCPECGFESSAHQRDDVAADVRANARRWRDLLTHPRAAERPRDDRWSAVEYGCHVVDVLDLAVTRIGRMIDEDDPVFANWDQDATAVESRYDLEEAAPTADRLSDSADALSRLLDGIQPEAWGRPSRRSDGSTFTVESFARYVVHDPIHHVWDVEQGFATLA